MMHILYLITRDDDQKYIGITIDYRLKNRMAQHKISPRFQMHSFVYDILLQDTSREIIENAEIDAIQKYDTFRNGLNSTIGGKGYNHNSLKFNTIGYKFSDASKARMSKAAKERALREGFDVRSKRSKSIWSDSDRRKKMSDIRKGKVSHFKLTVDDKVSIKNQFSKFTFDPIKSRNGQLLTRLRAFANEKSKQFNVTPQTIYGIINKD